MLSIKISPFCGLYNPKSKSTIVDLPTPVEPINATDCPYFISKFIF